MVMPICDHVALVVRELEPVVQRLADLGVVAGEVEEFPDEGTREVYLGEGSQPGKLLLLQPLGSEGPYARALAKRGPGLHHVAFHVAKAEEFLLEHPGWLLHPHSLDSFDRYRTLWLARPGEGTLVEVHQGEASYAGGPLVERLEVPVADPALEELLVGLGGSTVFAPGEAVVTVGGRATAVAALVR